MNKFEKLVEFIINEDEEKAQDLFHKIVVEKSREIYNELVNEQDQTDDFIDDIESDEEGTDMDMGIDDSEMDDSEMDDSEASEEELEDRVVDLEAALDELKAEFDAMVADDSSDMQPNDMDSEEEVDVEEDFGDEFEDDFDVFAEDEDDNEDSDMVREYVEKVAHPSKSEGSEVAKGGSVGVNKQSIVAKKNDMGGTAANMVKGGTAGTRPAPKAQEISSGNRNVPGGDAAPLQKAPAPKKGE